IPSLPNLRVTLANAFAGSLVREPAGLSRVVIGAESGTKALLIWLIAPKTPARTIITITTGINATNQSAFEAVAATCGPILISIRGIARAGSPRISKGTASWLCLRGLAVDRRGSVYIAQ